MKYLMIAAIFLMVSCSNDQGKATAADQEQAERKDTTTSETSGASPANDQTSNSPVNFKVNGVTANTLKTASDNDEDLGMLMAPNMELGLDLHGDDPAKPHRGWLHFTIHGFKLQPGTYTASGENSLRFTRYETANAGGSVDYYASAQSIYKGSNLSIEFTNISKNTAPGYEKEYLASGKFYAKLLPGEFSKSDTKAIEIAEGQFSNIRVTVLGQIK